MGEKQKYSHANEQMFTKNENILALVSESSVERLHSLHALKVLQICKLFRVLNEIIDKCQLNDAPKVDCTRTKTDNVWGLRDL